MDTTLLESYTVIASLLNQIKSERFHKLQTNPFISTYSTVQWSAFPRLTVRKPTGPCVFITEAHNIH